MFTPAKIEKLALLLRDKLHHGPPDLRRAYVQLLLSGVRVNDREIRISGSKAVLVRSAAAGVAKTMPAVLSFVREWYPPELPDFRGFGGVARPEGYELSVDREAIGVRFIRFGGR